MARKSPFLILRCGHLGDGVSHGDAHVDCFDRTEKSSFGVGPFGMGMDGDFENENRTDWQRRWAGVADRLETVLENNAYRFVLCAATVGLVVTYAIIAARMAEPARWVASPYVGIHESVEFDFRDTDALNRSISRLGKIALLLDLKPQKLILKPSIEDVRDPFAVETHVLRLWLDEARGFGPDGMYVVVSDAIAKAIVAAVFQDPRLFAKLPNPNSNWFGHVRTIGQSCQQDGVFKKNPICSVVKGRDDIPNPLSLSEWFASQMVTEARMYNAGSRITYLRQIARLSSSPELVPYERVSNWPQSSAKFGPVAKMIVSTLAPKRAKVITFKPYVPLMMIDLEKQGAITPPRSDIASIREEVEIGLLMVSSCESPKLESIMKSVEGFGARETVWVQGCANAQGLVKSSTAADFASANPNVVFAQIGVSELKTALARGWVGKDVDITTFVSASRDARTKGVSTLLRSQSEVWNASVRAFQMKAPVQVVKLVRL